LQWREAPPPRLRASAPSLRSGPRGVIFLLLLPPGPCLLCYSVGGRLPPGSLGSQFPCGAASR
jgi:hypothetical protein